MAFVGRLQNLDLSRSCYPSYGAPTLTPVGLSPTGRASLRWTHSGCFCGRSCPEGKSVQNTPPYSGERCEQLVQVRAGNGGKVRVWECGCTRLLKLRDECLKSNQFFAFDGGGNPMRRTKS